MGIFEARHRAAWGAFALGFAMVGSACSGNVTDGGGDPNENSSAASSGAASSGMASSDSGSSSSGGADAARADAGAGLFAFVVNGVPQSPLSCAHTNWQFAPQVPVPAGSTACVGGPPQADAAPYCTGVASAVIVDTGDVPLAYTAETIWDGARSEYPPGVDFGDPGELSGVLQPGGQVDVSSIYAGGVVAVLGSSMPFSAPSASRFVSDEGMIAWPPGVQGSEGSSVMYATEIEVVSDCDSVDAQEW